MRLSYAGCEQGAAATLGGSAEGFNPGRSLAASTVEALHAHTEA